MKTPYSDYAVLNKWDGPSFDSVTRATLSRRLHAIPPRRFFSEKQWQLLEVIVARLVPQPDRTVPIPIVAWIDDQLFADRREGFRHDNMPPMRDAWCQGLEAIDAQARQCHDCDFASLDDERRDALLRAIEHDNVDRSVWAGLPAARFFSEILLKTVVGIYYSHPGAWSEIGFGGPASPRGYVRLGFDERDPWEAREHR